MKLKERVVGEIMIKIKSGNMISVWGDIDKVIDKGKKGK